MYEIINEELKIKACGIEDLTAAQVGNFLGQWEDGAKIGSLTLFFEHQTGWLVINKGNDNFKTYLEVAESYLTLSKEKRKEIIEKSPKSMTETFFVLEKCLKYREVEMEISHAMMNYISDDKSFVVLNEIEDKYPADVAIRIAFRYGVMSGKRIERKK